MNFEVNGWGGLVVVAMCIGCVLGMGYFAKGCYIADKDSDTARLRICLEHGGQPNENGRCVVHQ